MQQRHSIACIIGAALAAGCGDSQATMAAESHDLGAEVTATVSALAATPRSSTSQREAARNVIVRRLAELDLPAVVSSYETGANVEATIPSTTGSGRRIIVGAHFDSAAGSPGANDNASGVAVVLAIARHVRELEERDAALTIVLFDEEERGLIGSRFYASSIEQGSVAAVVTIDQVSWDSDGDRSFELEKPTAELEAVFREAAGGVGATLQVTDTEGTDHQAFRERGIAAVGVTEEYVGGDTSPHAHRATDTLETVHGDYLELAARLAIAAIERLLA